MRSRMSLQVSSRLKTLAHSGNCGGQDCPPHTGNLPR
jgi:hypothetical protein